jgi:NTP pyrophosphatase (non-canonical NTP hydrolase)
MKLKSICKEALDTFGLDKQVDMCIEECAELQNALMKFRRGRATLEDVRTEIADVQIMCDQMSIAFGEKETLVEKCEKLERLAHRISEYQVKVSVKETARTARRS